MEVHIAKLHPIVDLVRDRKPAATCTPDTIFTVSNLKSATSIKSISTFVARCVCQEISARFSNLRSCTASMAASKVHYL